MNKKILIAASCCVIPIVIVGVILFVGSEAGDRSPRLERSEEQRVTSLPETENMIIHSDSGYTPVSLVMKVGTTVTFRNDSSQSMWPASDIHPTHEQYPGSGYAKCGKALEGTNFDACRPMPSGSTWSFQFNQVGTWSYHDHLWPGQKGTIVVEL